MEQKRKAPTAAIRLPILANLANLVDLVAKSALARAVVHQTVAIIDSKNAHTLTHLLGHLIGSQIYLQKIDLKMHAETSDTKLPISARLLNTNRI